MVNEPDFVYWAILIGIDCYWPSRIPGHLQELTLNGAVRDVDAMETFLRERLDLSPDHIFRLTSTASPDGKPLESIERLPTYPNIVKTIRNVADCAREGDHIVIFYAGHGALVRTKYPAIKGSQGYDEALAPYDVAQPRPQYLRDVEFGKLLQEMVDRGLHVTVILDCCHAGGATRGAAVRRSLVEPDMRTPDPLSLVADEDTLLRQWRTWSAAATRTLQAAPWSIPVNDYVLLAACSAYEHAFEYTFEPEVSYGVFTYWLLDALRTMHASTNYGTVIDRVRANVQAQFQDQTPQVVGVDKHIFGVERGRLPHAIKVLRCDGPHILLQTGRALGVNSGAQFAIYPAEYDASRYGSQQIALARIEEAGDVEAWARLLEPTPQILIEPGAQAFLIDVGQESLLRRVAVVIDPTAPEQVRTALDAASDVIRDNGAGFLKLVLPGEGAEFQIAVADNKLYEIWDSTGTPLPNIAPDLSISSSSAAYELVKRLVHLAQYRNVLEMANPDSSLQGNVLVELVGWTETYQEGALQDVRPIQWIDGAAVIPEGMWGYLRVKNLLPRVPGRYDRNVLHIAILALQSDWSIVQIYPSVDQDRPCDLIWPGDVAVYPFLASLPIDKERGRDTLKVMLSLEPVSYRALELSVLSETAEEFDSLYRNIPLSPRQMPEAITQSTAIAQPLDSPKSSLCSWFVVNNEVLTVYRPTVRT